MHVRRQMKECGFEQFEPTVIKEDNQAAKRLSEDVVESTRTRHWDKEYHQIREEFERRTKRNDSGSSLKMVVWFSNCTDRVRYVLLLW